jgi:hypothetical protein
MYPTTTGERDRPASDIDEGRWDLGREKQWRGYYYLGWLYDSCHHVPRILSNTFCTEHRVRKNIYPYIPICHSK